MAAPSPADVETLADELERQIMAYLAQGRGIEEAPQGIADFAEGLGATVAISGAGEAVGAAGGEAVAAGSALIDLALLPVALTAILILLILNWLHTGIRGLSAVIPMGQGNRYAQFVDFVFSPLTNLQNACAHFLATQLISALQSFRTVTWWVIGHETPQAGTPLAVINQQLVEPVHHEVDVLWGWVQSLAGEVTSLRQASISGAGGPGSGVGVPGGRLDQLEARVTALQSTLDHLGAAVASLQAANQTQDQEIATLRSLVYGVRAASVGAQDVFTQLDHLRQTIESVQAQQGTQLIHHTAELAQLAPLLSLLYLGERGLDNLRKLEQNPCQCPRLPGFNPLELDAFGVYEFLTNG